MLNLRKPSLNRVGVLKGAVVATVAFSAGIGVSALVMKQKYEDELNKLERDTAMSCLDFAAAHYEGVLQRCKKVSDDVAASTSQPVSKTPYYEEFLAFQHKLDSTGGCEPTEEERLAMEEEINQQQKEHEALVERLGEQSARMDVEFDRVKLKLLAEKATELANKIVAQRTEETDAGVAEF